MPFRFGQTILLILCLLVAGFLDFYLGARFGPEMFWGISLDRTGSNSILPTDVPNEEIEKMLAEESQESNLVFDEVLKRKGEVPGALVAVKSLVPEEGVKKEEKQQKTKVAEAKIAEPKAVEVKVAEIKSEIKKTTTSQYSLQVGSYSEKEKALSTRDKFQAMGLQARLGEVNMPQKGIWYRVYVGQYGSAEEAEMAKQQIYSSHQVMAVVVAGANGNSR